MKEGTLNLFPQPQRQVLTGGTFCYQGKIDLALCGELEGIKQAVLTICDGIFACGKAETSLTWKQENGLGEEGYRISVRQDGVMIAYETCRGAFYALMTLRQMHLANPGALLCCEIEDKPGLAMRGMMLDVSRGKVPSLKTLKQVADLLASLKYNHLELYLEGFSFAYPSFPDDWREDGALSPEEIKEFDQYCKERFLDLVPNQNCLGHMAQWLAKEEYSSLAELEDGLQVGNFRMPPTTLDARDERSLNLVRTMTEDVTACFSSPFFHAAMDEPFELGRGKNKEFVEQYGTGALFLGYVQKIHEILCEKHKKMMMWGDVAAQHEEILKEIPEDVVIMDWGYEAQHPVERRAETLKQSGHAFCLCPGTNSWNSFTGITDNMIYCIRQTAKAAHQYGAYGAMLTEWGDMGHMQYLPVIYAPVMLAGAMFWNPAEYSEDALADALNRYVFMDAQNVMGELALKAGEYAQLEEFRLPCCTMAGTVFRFAATEREELESGITQSMWINNLLLDPEVAQPYKVSYQSRKPLQAEKILAFLAEQKESLQQAELKCADAGLIVDEYRNAFWILEILTKIRALMYAADEEKKRAEYGELAEKIELMLTEHRQLWMKRNKAYGVEQGEGIFRKMQAALWEKAGEKRK